MSATEKKDLQLVKVFIRERPWTKSENDLKRICTIQKIQPTQISLKCGNMEKNYTFDRVFDKTASQEEVYEIVVSPLIRYVLSGYTCSVFAYGQTGTGKTYTMIGQDAALNIEFANDPSVGMVPRAAADLFAELATLQVEYNMLISFVEIYNEEVRDLLVSDSVPLRVFDDPDNKGSTCIKGLTEVLVHSISELYDFLNKGAAERQIASTNLNRLSSRSHTIFTIVLNIREMTTFDEETIKIGKFHLIDLAGSENIGRSGATEMRAREAGSINKSLLTLGKVIKALALKKQHVPYRESKLTRILQDSLGGTSKTSMIATFASTVDAFDETVSTLEYAHMAKNVANCPTVNINKHKTEVLTDSQNQILKLRQELNAMREGDGFYMSNDFYEKMTFDIQAKHERALYLLQEIETTEEAMAVQNQRYDELKNSFQSTSSLVEKAKKELAEAKIECKRKARAANFITGKTTQLEETSKALLDVCETSTKHEDVYYKKYDNQCDLLTNNANVSKSMYLTGMSWFKEILTMSNSSLKNQQTCFNDCKNRVGVIKGNQSQNLVQLDQISTQMKTALENPVGLVSGDVCGSDKLMNRLTSLRNSSSEACLHSLQNTKTDIEEVQSYVLEKNVDVEKRTEECTKLVNRKFDEIEQQRVEVDGFLNELCESLELSRIQQQLSQINKTKELQEQLVQMYSSRNDELDKELEHIDMMEEISDKIMATMEASSVKNLLDVQEDLIRFNTYLEPLQQVPTLVQRAIDTSDKNTASCKNQIVTYNSQAQQEISDFVKASTDELDRHNNELKTQLHNWAGHLDVVKQSLESTVEENVREISRQTEHFTRIENAYHSDVKQFKEKSYEDIQTKVTNLKTTIHAGDTPVKPVYTYPQEIDTEVSADILQEIMDVSLEVIEEQQEDVK
ncbi:hypothetical protein Zmor_024356 [Zophobas morio]|uniref:Kinesin-like protein n=1 Tax=Zophobas morio TaxID=2755281 RepID=A0AA38I4Z0_9CUCU|nr:hypothetical protein Zmor_024356 [Zophobas morio]